MLLCSYGHHCRILTKTGKEIKDKLLDIMKAEFDASERSRSKIHRRTFDWEFNEKKLEILFPAKWSDKPYYYGFQFASKWITNHAVFDALDVKIIQSDGCHSKGAFPGIFMEL